MDLRKEQFIMTRGMPSLAALLGLLAVAGYQNREKLGELLKEVTNPRGTPGSTGDASLPGDVKSITESGDPLKTIQGGLADIIDRFRNTGSGAAADSWVAKGPNEPITPNHTESALGSDLIDMLVKKTGLSREELLSRLSKVLPEAVDKLTPDGRLPAV
jgi:uncharacterized protein YidB (DUF937 family)